MLNPLPNRAHPLFLLCISMPVLAACSRADSKSDEARIPFYSDVVTLEVSIEEGTGEGDFQLVNPRDIGVDNSGNIYLADEHSVKVYRPDGTPLRLIGREGAGPGEFNGVTSVYISPTGCIASIDVLWETNIYAPDGEFLRRSRYRNENLFRDYLQDRGFTFSMLNEVVALDPDRLLIDLEAMNNTLPGPYTATAQLLYATPDTLFELCHYINYGTIKTGPNQTQGAHFQGSLLWCLPGGERVLYTETRVDRVEDGSRSRYHLILLDLATLSTDTLKVPWEPEPLLPAIRYMDSIYVGVLDRHYEVDPVIKEIMADTEYYPSLKAVRADRGIIFGFHFSPADSVVRVLDDLELEPHLADIVDLATGRLLARAEFPFLPDVIRDGMAYRLFRPADGFPAVHVYRIDRRLYELHRGLD